MNPTKLIAIIGLFGFASLARAAGGISGAGGGGGTLSISPEGSQLHVTLRDDGTGAVATVLPYFIQAGAVATTSPAMTMYQLPNDASGMSIMVGPDAPGEGGPGGAPGGAPGNGPQMVYQLDFNLKVSDLVMLGAGRDSGAVQFYGPFAAEFEAALTAAHVNSSFYSGLPYGCIMAGAAANVPFCWIGYGPVIIP